jgi:hypothetical protein
MLRRNLLETAEKQDGVIVGSRKLFRKDISALKRNVSTSRTLGDPDGRFIEINSIYMRSAQGIVVRRIKTVSATQIKRNATVRNCAVTQNSPFLPVDVARPAQMVKVMVEVFKTTTAPRFSVHPCQGFTNSYMGICSELEEHNKQHCIMSKFREKVADPGSVQPGNPCKPPSPGLRGRNSL